MRLELGTFIAHPGALTRVRGTEPTAALGCSETERPYAVAALPYPFTAFSIPEPAFAKSFAFIAGRTVSLALKARNHGSAMAGNSEESFISKNMYPVRSPLSSEK